MGSGRAKIWTYLILAGVLVVGTLVANFAFSNPDMAEGGVDAVAGLPSWAFPTLAASVGLIIFVIGLKLETDWPEALGALLVAGSAAAGQVMIGWQTFEFGGMVAVPYVIPVAIFLVMMGYSVARSR